MDAMYAQNILTATLAPMAANDGPSQSLWEWGYDGVEVGIWECAPGTLSGPTGDYDEMMCMVSGRVTVSHDGGEFDIAPGTAWVTPRHWDSTWTVHQTVRKLYVIDNRPGKLRRQRTSPMRTRLHSALRSRGPIRSRASRTNRPRNCGCTTG